MSITEMPKLKQLGFSKQLVFAYLTCERLYPNYIYFSTNFNYGDPFILRDSIDYIYLNLFESQNDNAKIYNLLDKVDNNTPDTEDYSTIYVSSALDACAAIQDTLNFLIDKEFRRIINISSYATDSVSMYVQEIENLDYYSDSFQEKIDTHPLMEKEIAIQSGIINFLIRHPIYEFEDITTLLSLQGHTKKKGNLDL